MGHSGSAADAGSAHDSDFTIADLYEGFESRLRRYAMSLVRDSDYAEDLVQETFVRAMANMALLKQLNHYQRQAWLLRVLKNLFLDEQRAGQRQQELFEELTRDDQVAAPASADPLARELLDLVPERYRELLHLRYVLGLTSVEIGRQVDAPPATVRSRLHLAIKWLRAHQSEFV